MKVIGHQKQIEQLEHLIETNQIGHAYIFEGISGIGKFTIAKEFAKKISMGNESILDGYLKIISPENNVIRVEEIRNLKEELMLKPTVAQRKVAIIDNAECMNEQAQNALLKILEEPPEHVTIILITINKEKLLYTIKSRCTIFHFEPLSKEEIEEYFGEPVEDELLDYARGSIGAILKLRENHDTEIVQKWIKAFQRVSLLEMMKDCNELKEDKYTKDNLQEILKYLLYFYHREMKDKKINTVEAIDIVEETRNHIMRNANVDIALDRMMIRLWKWRKSCKKL